MLTCLESERLEVSQLILVILGLMFVRLLLVFRHHQGTVVFFVFSVALQRHIFAAETW